MGSQRLFRNRVAAGRELAASLGTFASARPVVVGVARGGVPVACEVARALGATLDVCVVPKPGGPLEPTACVAVERYRRGRREVDLRDRTVIVVDDFVASGRTARAAIERARACGAGHVVLAAPVGDAEQLEALASVADEVVCPHRERDVEHARQWYDDFASIGDGDVCDILDRSDAVRRAGPSESVPRAAKQLDVRIPLNRAWLDGELTVPPAAIGLVVFVHGIGSSRHGTAERYIASELQRAGLATLLFDLRTRDEESSPTLGLDVRFLASRLLAATDWIVASPPAGRMPIGYFGAGTGAAAALVAAAERADCVHAVVARSGRPDLAGSTLARVRAPTLFVVGSHDSMVRAYGRAALDELRCEKDVVVVDDATHSFEEPGALEEVAGAAARWFVRHLGEAQRKLRVPGVAIAPQDRP